ncbi:MAG TPA: oxygenase MpaB family protein [Candidatus Limnocylindrales bacterium]
MDAPRADRLLGFYGPDSMMWRINREAVLLGAGPAALLLQIAHPSVARGVAEHSTFETDPFRRLHGTLRTTMDLVFGDGRAAERAVRRLNGIHARVRGEGYRALDPQLLLWVQATLIVTSVTAYQRWVGPLGAAERERFWQEARTVGVRLGIPLADSPADWPALQAYWRTMLAPDGPIQVGDTARRLAPLIVRPPLPLLPGALVDLLALPGMALLPPRLRDEFGVAWGPGQERLAGVLGHAIRGWVALMPAALRSMPQATAAFGRAARAGAQRTIAAT